MSFDIVNRTQAAIYHSDNAQTLLEALLEANLSGANLNEANLSGANLSGAYLSRANLSGANLSGANLRGADLSRADLNEANLSGANLNEANLNEANLNEANLNEANLSGANLSGAYLSGAYLRGANLSGAYLSGADLRGADLRGADLRGADLSGAKGVNKLFTSPLYMLLDQPGSIHAYKLVNSEGYGPHYPTIQYIVGSSFECDADTDEEQQCSHGINIATLDWCMKEWKAGYRILIVEHTAKDIAAIPLGTNGKYRVRRCKVVGEKDLTELGLITAEPELEGVPIK